MKRISLPLALAACLLMVASANAQKIVFGPSGLIAEGVDIDPQGPGGGATDTDVNNTTEGYTIYNAWVAAGKPATGPIAGGTYNVGASGTSTVSGLDFAGSNNDFTPNNPYPGGCCAGDDFIIHAQGAAAIKAGTYTISLEGDDGSSIIFNTIAGDDVLFNTNNVNNSTPNTNQLRFEDPTGNSNAHGTFTLTQDSVFAIEALFFERSGGDFWEVAIAPGTNLGQPDGTATHNGYEIFGDGALSGALTLFQSAQIVPEPATIAIWSLLGLALTGFGYYRVRRSK